MNEIITYIVVAVVAVAVLIALIKGLWKAAGALMIPIKIILFCVLVFCVGKIICTKENIGKLRDGVKEARIGEVVENAMSGGKKNVQASIPENNADKNSKQQTEVPPASASKTVTAAKPAEESAQVKSTDAPASQNVAVVKQATEEVAAKPTPPTPSADREAENLQPVKAEGKGEGKNAAEIQPPDSTPDYDRFDKGKKTFTYALPFSATVTVGFKDGTYRIMTDSIGTLGSSEKRQIGELIMQALSKYSGQKVSYVDKSQIDIEVKYNSTSNRTLVFAKVPPGACR